MLYNTKTIMSTLKDIYQTYWDGYIENIRNNNSIEPANPFLIVEPTDYRDKAVKVMICGQETQGWGNEFDACPESATVNAILRLYAGFVNGGGYNSPYWQFINSLKRACPNIGFVCNNIVKIGRKHGPGCDDRINELTLKYFPVIPEELNILKPDVILFLTGPNYDWRIRKTIGDFKTRQVDHIKKFDEIIFDNSSLPRAFRCYHPRYLRQSGEERDVLKYMVQFLKNCVEANTQTK